MMLRRTSSLLLTLTVLFLMSACQAATETPAPQKQILANPSSVGPSEPPSVKGPTTPPPNSHDQPQAVTEVERVQFILPTSEAEFKN